MSNLTLGGDLSGTGTVTLTAPNTNTNRTVTLPDASTTLLGTSNLATQAQAEAGTDNTTLMTPLRTEQHMVAHFATQAQAEAGTDNTTLMTPLRVEQHMVANNLGQGQTWQAVTRVANTTYQNTTGRPIMVYASISNTSGIQYFQVSTDASTWINAGNSVAANAPNQVVVPNGIYYRVTQTVGTTSISATELR
jgi:hypothetical protein